MQVYLPLLYSTLTQEPRNIYRNSGTPETELAFCLGFRAKVCILQKVSAPEVVSHRVGHLWHQADTVNDPIH